MRFLVDAQLPPALARWLVSQGHEAEHVMDCGLLDAPDEAIWAYALERGAAVLTKDEDFALRRTLNPDGPAIVWLRVGNTRKAALLRWFEPLLPEALSALSRGEALLEIA